MSLQKRGSNQYRVQNRARPRDFALKPPLYICGEVWGTKCRVAVHPPDFSHGSHGANIVGHLKEYSHSRPSPAILALMQDSNKTVIQELLAVHPLTPPHVLDKLVRASTQYIVRIWALFNPNCPESTLSYAINTNVYRQTDAGRLARHKNISPQGIQTILDKVTLTEAEQSWLIQTRKDLPSEILERLLLSESANPRVRAEIVSHPHCPPSILAKLATDASVVVRRAVAANPNCPPQTLQALLKSKDNSIRKNLKTNANLPTHLKALLLLAE